jgi:thioredoxin reductase
MSQYDVVVIGGGATGVSAALVLSGAHRKVLVVDAGMPLNGQAVHLRGDLSRDGLTPSELLDLGRDELGRYVGGVLTGTTTELVADGNNGFWRRLAGGQRILAGRMVVVAGVCVGLRVVGGRRVLAGRMVVVAGVCVGLRVVGGRRVLAGRVVVVAGVCVGLRVVGGRRVLAGRMVVVAGVCVGLRVVGGRRVLAGRMVVVAGVCVGLRVVGGRRVLAGRVVVVAGVCVGLPVVGGRRVLAGRVVVVAGVCVGLPVVGGWRVLAGRVLVAAGLYDELMDILGLRDRWARDVLHCPCCHGYEVCDRRLGVIGGSSGAVRYAQIVRQWTHELVYFTPPDALTATERSASSARGIGVVAGTVSLSHNRAEVTSRRGTGVQLIVEGGRLRGVQLVDGSVVARDVLFVPPEFVPNDHLLRSLGRAVDDGGWGAVEATGRTGVPGVWGAGDVVATRPGRHRHRHRRLRRPRSRSTPTWSRTTYAKPFTTSFTDLSRTHHHHNTKERYDHPEPPHQCRPQPARGRPADQASVGVDDLAGRLPDPHRPQPDPRRLAGHARARTAHIRAGHHRRTDRDLRRDAATPPAPHPHPARSADR